MVISFSNELNLIYLHTVKWFQVLLYKTKFSISHSFTHSLKVISFSNELNLICVLTHFAIVSTKLVSSIPI